MKHYRDGVYEMANFNPAMIVPASKSTEFAESANQERTAKSVLLDGIKRQLEFYANPSKEGRRWFTIGQKEVALTLRIGNKPLKLNGEEAKVVVPTEHFEAAMKHFAAEVAKGSFDEQLKLADKAMGERKEKLRKTRQARKAA